MINKRWKITLMPVGVAIALAGGLVFAQMRSGSYGSSNAPNIGQAAAPGFAPDAKYDAGPYPSLTPQLAEGDGRQEVQSFCAICHSTRYITMQPPLPGTTWEAEVSKMIKTYGAPIPEATAKKITAYLQAHYSPENRKE
jgi:mono/diheme cytochrome c family protein